MVDSVELEVNEVLLHLVQGPVHGDESRRIVGEVGPGFVYCSTKTQLISDEGLLIAHGGQIDIGHRQPYGLPEIG